MYSIKVFKDTKPVSDVQVVGRMTIGRNPDRKIQLEDGVVSREHGELFIEETRLIYASEVGISYLITSITVRSQANDPYSCSDAGTLLDQFRTIWNQAFGGVQRDVAHLFTGRPLNGSVIGVAYLDVLCNKPLAYGLSESRFTSNLVQRVAVAINWHGAGAVLDDERGMGTRTLALIESCDAIDRDRSGVVQTFEHEVIRSDADRCDHAD